MPEMKLPDGDTLYYEVQGDGPPLMLVSGLSGLASFWDVHTAELARRFKVIVHDHRGTGRSARPRMTYSVDQMARDAIALMDHLDIERAHLAGHSTGGAIGQTIALDHPDRLDRLVLSSSWAAADTYFRHLFKVRASILERAGPAVYTMATELFMKPAAWFRDHAPQMDLSDEAAAEMISDTAIALARIEAILRFDRKAELGHIEASTLIACARDDMVTPIYLSEELARLIAGSRTELYAAGGHFFPRLYPSQFNNLLGGFLLG
ncbi:MAG: alpha/beta fold hydrolase [Gammaproteobacteria bacterium]